MVRMYDRKDAYYRQAKKEGYRSRAAYKLTQIAAKEKAVRPGDRVIDAGAAPGGWSQVLLGMVGGKGKIAAVDLLPMATLPGENFRFWQRDLTDPALPAELLEFLGGKADAVVSDAAPNTTGSSFTDQARSADLVRAVFGLARDTLRDGGTFLAKIFGKMTRYGVLTSHRGKTRGYSLAKPPSELTVRQVLEAVDGPDLFERCIFWTETCNDENPCPLHNSWKDLKPLIAQRMTEVTLDKIAVDGNLAAGGDRSPSA